MSKDEKSNSEEEELSFWKMITQERPLVPTYGKTPEQIDKLKHPRLNMSPNQEGFNKRRMNGQKAGAEFLASLSKSATEESIPVDIIAHSMGYAYALGMADVLKDKIPLGCFYIIAPENAEAGEING